MDGKIYQPGEDITPPKNEVQSLIDSGAVEGTRTKTEVGTPTNPSRFGAGEQAPQMSEETIDAQIAELEARKKALQESKSTSEKSDESTDSESNEPKPLDKMNHGELVEVAKARGVAFDESMTKKELIALLSV
jgi:hypothetical protein